MGNVMQTIWKEWIKAATHDGIGAGKEIWKTIIFQVPWSGRGKGEEFIPQIWFKHSKGDSGLWE